MQKWKRAEGPVINYELMRAEWWWWYWWHQPHNYLMSLGFLSFISVNIIYRIMNNIHLFFYVVSVCWNYPAKFRFPFFATFFYPAKFRYPVIFSFLSIPSFFSPLLVFLLLRTHVPFLPLVYLFLYFMCSLFYVYPFRSCVLGLCVPMLGCQLQHNSKH